MHSTMRLLLAASVMLAPVVTCAQAEKKIDQTGNRLFSVTTDDGTGTPTVTLKQSGDTLSGHYSSQAFGEMDFKGGTVKDKKISFKFSADVQGTQFVVTYTGT